MVNTRTVKRNYIHKVGADVGEKLDWITEKHPLHWSPKIERRGLGWTIQKVNHLGLIVADVGTSAAFYSDVLGLQQVPHRHLTLEIGEGVSLNAL